jgi:hypothetical protein
VSGLLPKEGWCFTRPLQAPTHCRWCGKALKFVRARALACPDCDLIGEWPNGNAERPRVSFTNMSEFEALGMVSAAHEALKILCERHVDLEQDDDDDDDDDDWDDDDDD